MKNLKQPLIRQSFAFFLLLLSNLFYLQGCGSSSSGNPNPDPLAITTTSLPGGQVGVAYIASLVATGGTTPYNWTLIGGTLPANLQLNAATGAITGTPAGPVTNLTLTVQVQDSGNPVQTKMANLVLTINPALGVGVSISPKGGGLVLNQTLPLTATVTNDVGAAGVTWSVSTGGQLTGQSTTKASFSSAVAGVYTIAATSKADGTTAASITVGVTDLAGVTTYHNNLSRNGSNTQEYALTTANVTASSFGKLFSCTVDGAIYAQPLWVPSLAIGGGTHNVVFVATTHDSVYAFDADTSPCLLYWKKTLLSAGETFVNFNDVHTTDIQPDIGIIGTPVIDLTSKTLYVVSKSEDAGTSCIPSSACHQRLHGLSLIDGSEKFGGPANIDASITVAGTGDGSSGGVLGFNSLTENQRPGLALVNGVVYVSWASHGDNDPYHGWVIGFSAGNLGVASVV
ncbi:MAG TPA: Ig domain-containing protein, partial [Candidatus Limnocylindrales bacterium]|nr:Ig domain-containing protein [Candidatus Limnocylindrales bacterium]